MPLWSPSDQQVRNSNISRFIDWLARTRSLSFDGYQSLWEWSTAEYETFWTSILEYFEVDYDGEFRPVTNGKAMPDVAWFPGIRLNYSEHIFRKASADRPAIIFRNESGIRIEYSWKLLETQVAAFQNFLQASGVQAGDRVAAYLPCIPEATVAFLATNALGAIWSSCSPDFGTAAVIDRFAQIEPKIFLGVTHYTYGGKNFDKTITLHEILDGLPTVERIVTVGKAGAQPITNAVVWDRIMEGESNRKILFNRVDFNHPMWILYSSGTTGKPKAIVHSQGGILLEHLKYGAFHNDYHSGQRCFWFTTTGWMMWNYMQSCLLAGCTLVLYDGNPGYPDLDTLWKMIDDEQISHFGTSASFILANQKRGLSPKTQHSFDSLCSISSTGSTLPPESFGWIYGEVKSVWLASMSGGTDVCSAFVGGNPTWPVHAGEIQCRALGCDLDSWNEDGKSVMETTGEMVIKSPMPSMPVFFWNDPDGVRYRESYFETYPGIWRHGDWISITRNLGVVIYGRSDATLNRDGIRIGTSEVYRAVESVREVKDSLIVCIEKNDGRFWMPLFVILQQGQTLTSELKNRINTTLRGDFSPRHVPDEIIEVPDLPYTISGKKTEAPVKKILMGKAPDQIMQTGSLRNPDSLNFFVALARKLKEAS